MNSKYLQTFCFLFRENRIAKSRIECKFNCAAVDIPTWVELGWIVASNPFKTIYGRDAYHIQITETGLDVLAFDEL